MTTYSKNFFNINKRGSLKSARQIVPLVLKLIEPRSVIDVGCGMGAWLSVFKSGGVDDIFGIDGDYVEQSILLIPADKFLAHDLRKPLNSINRKFDLVVSLEVAEHISSEAEEYFINTLIGLGPVILFSAAVPYQGGLNHLNERWQDYWVSVFGKKGYMVVDFLRKRIWNNQEVDWWYRQNIFLFVEQAKITKFPLLKSELSKNQGIPHSVIHPQNYLSYNKNIFLKRLIYLFWLYGKEKLGKFFKKI